MMFKFEVSVELDVWGENQKHASMRLESLLQEGEAIVNYEGAGEIGIPTIIARVVKLSHYETSQRSKIDTKEKS